MSRNINVVVIELHEMSGHNNYLSENIFLVVTKNTSGL